MNWLKKDGQERSINHELEKHNIYWFLKRNKIPDTIWNRSKYGTKLVIDDLYSLKESVKILRMGEKVKKSWESYRAVWGYYNSGTIYNDELGIQYGERIYQKVQVLKYVFKHRLKKL